LITTPVPLSRDHVTAGFRSGEASLDSWLRHRALKNQLSSSSRTHVICNEERIIGFYTLAAGSIERSEAPRNIARNAPDPIPVIILARLAVDEDFSGLGLGAGLLSNALLRTLAVAAEVGAKAVLTHALSEKAASFYRKYGFTSSPIDDMTLMLPMKTILAHVGSNSFDQW
jgi:GNAT superfamily N-acetyltransferase